MWQKNSWSGKFCGVQRVIANFFVKGEKIFTPEPTNNFA
jgi:hypothetical protein